MVAAAVAERVLEGKSAKRRVYVAIPIVMNSVQERNVVPTDAVVIAENAPLASYAAHRVYAFLTANANLSVPGLSAVQMVAAEAAESVRVLRVAPRVALAAHLNVLERLAETMVAVGNAVPAPQVSSAFQGSALSIRVANLSVVERVVALTAAGVPAGCVQQVICAVMACATARLLAVVYLAPHRADVMLPSLGANHARSGGARFCCFVSLPDGNVLAFDQVLSDIENAPTRRWYGCHADTNVCDEGVDQCLPVTRTEP